MLLHAPSFGYESTYTVQAHEIDAAKRIKPTALLQLMQEASMQNAINLKISVYELEQQNVSWVLLKKDLQVSRWPGLGDQIRIITYPAGIERIFAYRDYIAYDQDDNLIAHASSTWTLMNLNTRKVERIPKSFLDLVPRTVDDALPRPITKIPEISTSSLTYDHTIRYFDLDWNGHVNNVALTKFMLQGIPIEHWQQYQLQRYAIQIKAECRISEVVIVQSQQLDGETRHAIVGEDGRIVGVAVGWWG